MMDAQISALARRSGSRWRNHICVSVNRIATLCIRLLEAEPRFGGRQVYFPAGLQVGQPSHHRTHEGPLFLGRFIVDEGLNYCNPASTARNEHRPVLVRRAPNYAAGIDFKVGNRDYVL